MTSSNGAASVESIVLGCTHYPLLVPLLRQLLPDAVQIIDPAIGVARQLDALLGPPDRISSIQSPFSLKSCRHAKAGIARKWW